MRDKDRRSRVSFGFFFFVFADWVRCYPQGGRGEGVASESPACPQHMRGIRHWALSMGVCADLGPHA